MTKLIGRLYFQDDPFHINNTVKPGVLPINLDSAVSSVALVGTLTGQLLFGYLGDCVGRKVVYGITLMIMIFCAIGQSMSFGGTANSVIGTLCFWRFLLGVGIGGDYPLSATIMSEYSSRLSRGAFISAVFAMQGIGYLTACAVSTAVIAGYNNVIESGPFPQSIYGCKSWSSNFNTTESKILKSSGCPAYRKDAYIQAIAKSCPIEVDHVWRTVLCIGAIPAAMTLYFREKMPETPRFTLHKEGNAAQMIADMKEVTGESPLIVTRESVDLKGDSQEPINSHVTEISFPEFLSKFGVQLLGCAMCWLLLDIAFYSQNLFQKDVFLQVGWLPPNIKMNAMTEAAAIARAQAIIALGSTIPGYWFTVFTVDFLGRRNIQFMGFVMMTAFMAANAGGYHYLLNPNNPHNQGLSNDQPGKKNGWIVMYALCFFFANFGPNATTFVIPAELFPTQWKSTGHGISAASGKVGAIIGAFGFLFAAQPVQGEVTWSFPCYSPFDTYADTGGCKLKNNCPTGRQVPSSVTSVSTIKKLPQDCSLCTPYVLSGCADYGLSVAGALGILAGTNFLGMWFTLLVPEPMGKSLEELNGSA